MAKQTPMMQQYLEIKAQYEDAFLFFRLGDFYELFFEDAKKAAHELEITLTSRGGTHDRIPMCGVPYHSVDQYIQQLIEKGYKIAICEQVEDPKEAKGVVKREVVKLITPGTVMEANLLNDKENNYLATVADFEDGSFGFGRTDLSTGESAVTLIEGDLNDVIYELASISAKEVVVLEAFASKYEDTLEQQLNLTVSVEEERELPESMEGLCSELEQSKLIETMAPLFHYLIKTQKRSLDHLQKVTYYSRNEYLKIDYHSKRNLELTETIREKKKQGSLYSILDKTETSMGARLLKKWLEQPLIDRKKITERHSVVQSLLDNFFIREELKDKLKEVYDLERLAGKVAYGNVNARELVMLRRSLHQAPSIFALANELHNPYLDAMLKNIDICADLRQLLETSLVDEPPISIKEGGMIRDGYHQALDEYRDASRNGKQWIAELEQKERQQTGIKSLKIGYNKVFGYYIEVTRANLQSLELDRYERKQTLANAERFITPELKEKEALILEAEEKIDDLEYDLFVAIREETKTYIAKLQQLAKALSMLDVLQSFATVSEARHYVCPQFSEDREISILAGRHPVVETVIGKGEYVKNDVVMNGERELLLITGPNMAGKSTYMRQLALIAIMAQIGCFVPADDAILPIFDQVFTRIGAADDLASGQSTFMVEMLETKHALTKATQNSLILLDEIGRGTSTYDGIALAQAIIEYIHHHIRAKTLFSTHYHELTVLEEQLPALKNVHVSAIEENGKVVFLHKVIDGSADRSYGIYVAELAELPKEVITRADEILATLEKPKTSLSAQKEKVEQSTVHEAKQLSLFADDALVKEERKTVDKSERAIIDAIQKADILNMTPLEALKQLNDLQAKLRKR